MKDIPEPTLELLSRLLGKRTAKRVYRGSLADLFLDETLPEEVKARLRRPASWSSAGCWRTCVGIRS